MTANHLWTTHTTIEPALPAGEPPIPLRVTTPGLSMPGFLLRMEGLAVTLVAVSLYAVNGFGWWMLALLVLAPDLSALGYLVGRRTGAVSYNIIHTYTLPLTLGMTGFLLSEPLALQLALIWFVHIGVDRFAGYGFKYRDSFKHTHMQAVNRL